MTRLLSLTATLVILVAASCRPTDRTTPVPSPDNDPFPTRDAGPVEHVDPEPVVDAGPADSGTDAGDVDAGPVEPVDAGPVDAGPADVGPVDAGPVDAGPVDAGPTDPPVDPNLEPMRPECANRQGGEDCWFEWLKEIGDPAFTPVAKGAHGAGPWTTSDFVNLDSSKGLSGSIVGVGVDSAQNVYAVSTGALFVRKAGGGSFTRFARNTNGLRDYRLISVAGAGPNVAYVGYEGVFGVDPTNESSETRKSGDVSKISLVAAGIEAKTLDTHNSNTPASGKYDHSRIIFEIVIPKRGPAAGELFLGTEHGVVRYQGERYVDHRHIDTVINGSQRFGSTRGLTVRDDGTMWYGNDFKFGGLAWTPRLAEWYLTGWMFPSVAYAPEEDRDFVEGIGVDSTGNHVWIAANTHGIAHLTVESYDRKRSTKETLSAPDANMHDLVVDLNDTVWVGSESGLHRYDPVAKKWTAFGRGVSGVWDLYLDDTVTPRALYIAHHGGVGVYRGP